MCVCVCVCVCVLVCVCVHVCVILCDDALMCYRLIRVSAQEQLIHCVTRCCTNSEVVLDTIKLLFNALEVPKLISCTHCYNMYCLYNNYFADQCK